MDERVFEKSLHSLCIFDCPKAQNAYSLSKLQGEINKLINNSAEERESIITVC